MKISRLVQLAAVATLATACAQKPATIPQPEVAEIQTALNARLGDFAKAIAEKDPVAVANMFTEDGTWILPDASKYTGRASIEQEARTYFKTFESFIFDGPTIDKLIIANSSEAFTFSHGNYTLKESGNPAVRRVNPVADYWKKGLDGVWRVAYELNADGPMAATATTTSR